jgi:hypothetical protein
MRQRRDCALVYQRADSPRNNNDHAGWREYLALLLPAFSIP